MEENLPPPPTDTELEILQVLWGKHPESVRFVNDTLNARRNPGQKEIGYTTTLKMMQLMLEKGQLTREIVERNHFYSPAASQETTQTQVIRSLASRGFGGSASQLALRALGSGDASPDDILKIKALIQALEKGE